MGFAIAAAASAVVGAYGSYEQGQAAQGAATAQGRQAQAYQQFISGNTQKALDQVGAGYTPAQMSAYDDALSKQEASVQRQETLAQSLSPALVSAGKQMNDLLQGQSAPVLQNLQNQRGLQRQQVIDQLKTQIGPGAETSTAGQQALQKFDADTANMMSGAQQSYLSQLQGVVQSGNSIESGISQGSGMQASIQGMDPQTRANTLKANIIQGGTQQSQGAQQAMINAAGGQYAGQQAQGKMLQGLGQNIASAAGAYYGQKSLNKTPATTPNPSGSGSGGTLGSTFMNGGTQSSDNQGYGMQNTAQVA